jgi:hypothetical protein
MSSVAVWEHAGVAGLVTGSRRQETAALFAALFVFVAVAVTATAIEMTRKEEAPAAWPSGRSTEAQAMRALPGW